MGLGGIKFRTWSGPGGSSHKGPLTSAHAYPGHFFHGSCEPRDSSTLRVSLVAR